MANRKSSRLALRSEVAVESTWNLRIMYSSPAEWEREFREIPRHIEDFLRFRGRLAESDDMLLGALQADDALDRLLDKLGTYAHLMSDQDTSDSKNLSRLEKISSRAAEIEGETAWFIPEIMGLSSERLDQYMAGAKLAFYRHSLREILRDRPHTLGAAEERILGLASDALATSHNVFSVLSDADLRFPAISDEKGRKVMLTHGNYGRFLESADREVRRSAFEALHKTYYDFRGTFATILDGTVKSNILEAKLRNFDSPLAAALHGENIPLGIYDNVIGSVRSNLHLFHRCLEIRRRKLGVDRLEMYDLRCPLVPEYSKKYSWEDACEILYGSLEPLGEECIQIAREAVADRWIDIYENRGKRSGAYSSGCYDSPPYILMNYNGTLNEVFTLAHEMGHSLHSHLTNRRQDFHYSDISIFLSEIASNVGELLMFRHIYENTADEKFRWYMMDRLADDFRTVVFRQAMFSEFERTIYTERNSGEPLTHDMLCETYYKLNREYHGGLAGVKRTVQSEWARIPHFHYNFYVFKYVTGLVAALKIAEMLQGDRAYRSRYIDFLSAGSSEDPEVILRNAGIDLEDRKIYECCFERFREVLESLEKIPSI